MINCIILSALVLGVFLSIVTVIAEPLTARNSPAGKFFRFFRIRLRDISVMSFCVTSILLLFWGLCVGDSEFSGIWTAVLMLLLILLIVHWHKFLLRRRRRKKAAPGRLLPLTPLMQREAALAGEAPLLPISPEKSSEIISEKEEIK